MKKTKILYPSSKKERNFILFTSKLPKALDSMADYWFRIIEYMVVVSLLAFVSAVEKTIYFKFLYYFSGSLLTTYITIKIITGLIKILNLKVGIPIPTYKIIFFLVTVIFSGYIISTFVFWTSRGLVEQWL